MESEDIVIGEARKEWRKKFPSALLLLLGDIAGVEPKIILDVNGIEIDVERINKMAVKYYVTDRALPDNDDGWKIRTQLCDEWEILIRKALSTKKE